MVEHEPQRKKGIQYCLRGMNNLQDISSSIYGGIIFSFPLPIPSFEYIHTLSHSCLTAPNLISLRVDR